jgi:hypothetical protein
MQCLVTRMVASLRFPTIFVLLAWGAVLPAAAQNLSGTVKSGTVPIPGTTVTLYMAGYDRGIPPSVLSSAVSDASGHFVIKVPPLRANDVLYVTARGLMRSVDLAAMLGTYRNVSWFVSDFVVNELSTVATVWAMAQFMSGDDIGGKSPGLQNAAATVGNMVDVKTGTIATVLATPPNGSQTTTLAEFNSLANLISACVDTPVNCSQLFSLSTPPGGATPANTLQAALTIAHNPWNNVAQLFTLSRSNSNYAPVLPSAPDAWTIVLQYYGNGMELNGPGNMAVDAEGNIYITINYNFQTNACGGKIVSKLTPTGTDAPGAPFKGGGVNGAGWGVTIDPTGDIWIGNFGFAGDMCATPPSANSVSKFTPTGRALSPANTGFTGKGFIHSPQGVVSVASRGW